MNHTTLDQARAAKAKVLAAFGHDASVVGVSITRIGEGYGVKLNLEAPPRPRSQSAQGRRRRPRPGRSRWNHPETLNFANVAATPTCRGHPR